MPIVDRLLPSTCSEIADLPVPNFSFRHKHSWDFSLHFATAMKRRLHKSGGFKFLAALTKLQSSRRQLILSAILWILYRKGFTTNVFFFFVLLQIFFCDENMFQVSFSLFSIYWETQMASSVTMLLFYFWLMKMDWICISLLCLSRPYTLDTKAHKKYPFVFVEL